MQKRLFMKCVCKFWHHSSIPLPQFPYSVRNFGDLETISSYVLCAESQPYICFRFVWPTDLESVLHSLTPTVIISTNFEVDMIIQVIVFLLLIHYVTLWPWLLTFWPWMVHGRSHEDCHCTHIWNPHLRFVYSLCNFGGSMMKVIQVLFVLCQKPYEFLYMCKIMSSVKGALNFLLQSFLSTSIYRIGLQKLSI